MANLVKKSRNKFYKEQIELEIRKAAYSKKFDEFMGMTLDQLKEYWTNKKPGGVHKAAIIEACRIKQEEAKKADAATTNPQESDNNIQHEQSS